MPGSFKSIDDDDDVAKLMPRVAKLIREDHSGSMELNGSTSMSLCGSSGKGNVEMQNAKPSRKRRAKAVLRDVANKFLRKGAIGKRSIGACKPSALDALSSYYSSFADRRNAHVLEKENLRPKASTLVKNGVPPAIQPKIAMRDTPQKGAREFRKIRTLSVVQRRIMNPKEQEAVEANTRMVRPEHHATQAATIPLPAASHSIQGSEESCCISNLAAKSRRNKVKLNVKTTPISLIELQEKFAELDGEALEEEEVSIAHLTSIRPVFVHKTVLQEQNDISENVADNRKDLSRNVNGREDDVGGALNPNLEKSTIPSYTLQRGQGGIGICTTQSKFMSKSHGRDQDVHRKCCNEI